MSGWWDYLKQQSETIIQACKEDLAEFSGQITTDSQDAVKQLQQEITLRVDGVDLPDVVKHMVSPTMGGDESTSDTPSTTLTKANASTKITSTREEEDILNLRSSVDTYALDPMDVPAEQEAYSSWSLEFDVSKEKAAIAALLVESSHVRDLHTHLVPDRVDYEEFWSRYFFRLHLYKEGQRRRAALFEQVEDDQDELGGWDWVGEEHDGPQVGEGEHGLREDMTAAPSDDGAGMSKRPHDDVYQAVKQDDDEHGPSDESSTQPEASPNGGGVGGGGGTPVSMIASPVTDDMNDAKGMLDITEEKDDPESLRDVVIPQDDLDAELDLIGSAKNSSPAMAKDDEEINWEDLLDGDDESFLIEDDDDDTDGWS